MNTRSVPAPRTIFTTHQGPATRPAVVRLLAAGLIWLACGGTLQAQDRTEVEQQLRQLKQEIESVQEQLRSARGEKDIMLDALESNEREINRLTRGLRRIDRQMTEKQALLVDLNAQKVQLDKDLADEKSALSDQLRATHQLGSQSRLKLLLNQEDISSLTRMLVYYRFFNQARAEEIDAVTLQLQELVDLHRDIAHETDQLENLRITQSAEINAKEKAQSLRRELVARINSRIATDQRQLSELRRNQADLEQLLARLSQALADIPKELGRATDFRAQRGAVPWPVSGRRASSFGTARGGGVSWQGWLIRATHGSDVKAVAYGRVAFADWLRGYGMLMIIDHGDGYMSLYGHNEALFHEVGDWVDSGDVIAAVGSSGGETQPGLYFELRKDGKAINPSGWMQRP